MSDYYTQMSACLMLQDKMNKTVNENWLTAGYNWSAATLVETGELIDHLGYKWWKKQETNIPQAFIELVDIFHFELSSELVDYNTYGTEDFDLAKYLQHTLFRGFDDADSLIEDLNTTITIENIIDEVVTSSKGGGMGVYDIGYITRFMGYTLEDLFAQYIPKNTLNIFRQANGYKDGTYVKTWNGVEDNVFLERLIKEDPVLAQDFDLLWDALATEYEKVTGKTEMRELK